MLFPGSCWGRLMSKKVQKKGLVEQLSVWTLAYCKAPPLAARPKLAGWVAVL